jgi:hypothetical protein
MVVASPVEHAMGVLTATLPKAVTNNTKGPPSASATLRCGTPKNARFMRVEHGGLSGFGETKSFIPVDVITRISADEVYINHSREHVASAPRYDPDLVDDRTYYANLYGHYGYTPFGGEVLPLGSG